MANSLTAAEGQAAAPKEMLKCGEVGSYSKLKEKAAAPDYERDHIPSKAALLQAAKNKRPGMTGEEVACVKAKVTARGICIAIPKSAHRGFSPTCGGRNTPDQIKTDAGNLSTAVKKDTDEMQKHLDSKEDDPECAAAYKEAAKKVNEHDNDSMIQKAIDECTGG